MNQSSPRIYLDHAATSWPKSDDVLATMIDFARQCGAAAGRGGYRSAAEADRVVAGCRRSIAKLINADSAENISLHSNGTSALNVAIHGVLRAGDHVVTTAAEHNSVLRPLHYLESDSRISLTVVPVDQDGAVDANELIDSVTATTRLVALTHASNVTGCVQPIAAVGQALSAHPALFLCDAAQTFGALPIDVVASHVDLLAAPGHKASGGPLGTGFLYASSVAQQQLVPNAHELPEQIGSRKPECPGTRRLACRATAARSRWIGAASAGFVCLERIALPTAGVNPRTAHLRAIPLAANRKCYHRWICSDGRVSDFGCRVWHRNPRRYALCRVNPSVYRQRRPGDVTDERLAYHIPLRNHCGDRCADTDRRQFGIIASLSLESIKMVWIAKVDP